MKYKLFLISLAIVSILLGSVYSIYNTDPHHWGFIVGTALDFIRGKWLFSEVYVQYGAGQAILFRVLSFVLPINYTSVGILTSVAYALHLLVLFACVRRISNAKLALQITAIAFLIHPFAIYPWPDYFAGLCISLACYCLLAATQHGGRSRYVATGLFLFLAFVFRNSYLLSISGALMVFLCLSSLSKDGRKHQLYLSISVFAGLVAAYLAFLSFQGNAGRWYTQNFGAATGSSYEYGILTVVRSLLDLVVTENLSLTVFLGLFLINAHTILSLLRNGEKEIVNGESERSDRWVGIFLCVLGCVGISQSLHSLEVFRLQNSSMPLYLGLAWFLSVGPPGALRIGNWRGWNLSLGLLAAILLVRAPFILKATPNSSTNWPIVAHPVRSSIRSFTPSDVPFFRFHRFQSAENLYYARLSNFLCDGKGKIVNLTRESAIPYLCPGQDHTLILPFFNPELLRRADVKETKRVEAGQFLPNELIVADEPPPSNSSVALVLIGVAERPLSIRWLEPARVSVFRVVPGAATPPRSPSTPSQTDPTPPSS